MPGRSAEFPLYRRRVLCGLLIASATLAAGCAVTPAPDGAAIRDEALQGVAMRGDWAGAAADGEVAAGWLASFADAELESLVAQALARGIDPILRRTVRRTPDTSMGRDGILRHTEQA